jgi:hypothetical protein
MFNLCNEIHHVNGFRTPITSASIDPTQVETTDHFQAYCILRTKLTEHARLNHEPVLDLLVRPTGGFNWIAAQAEQVHAEPSNTFETVEFFLYKGEEKAEDASNNLMQPDFDNNLNI